MQNCGMTFNCANTKNMICYRYWWSKILTAQYKMMYTAAEGNMPLSDCNWRDTHGKFYLS